MISRHKEDCVQLLEQTQQVLNAIVLLHIKSDAGGDMPPALLHHIGKLTEYFAFSSQICIRLTIGVRILYKIHIFVEAQQKGNKVKTFFRQSENNTLLKDCRTGFTTKS
jgi:hypothetical protein